jgi:protein-tyrosine phosphatase
MIDLSCHLLEGTGCGPDSVEESVEMCRLAEEAGVRTIVATPCWEAGATSPPVPLAECCRKLDSLRERVGSQLALKFGFMFQYSADIPALTDTFGAVLALGQGRHLLISLPATQLPRDMEKTWDELARRGYSVVLARPECSPALRSQRDRLDEWVRRGAKIQIAAASVTGGHGRTVKQFAMESFNAYGESVVLATRARSARASDFILGHAKEAVAKKFGASRAHASVNSTPLEIIGAVPERSSSTSGSNSSAARPPTSIGTFRSALALLKATV